MTNYRNRLPLDQAIPGMMLCEPLRDAKGDVLLPQGATLTEAVLAALERRGIDLLPIATSDEEPMSDADLQALREHARERIARLFRRCDADGADGADGASTASGTLRQYVTALRMEKPI